MAKNYSQHGNVLNYTAGASIDSGDAVLMGDTLGVALSDATSGDEIAVQIEGVFELPKVTGAINIGDKLDWDDSEDALGKGITPASGDIIGCGIAAAGAASGDETVMVKLTPGTGALET